jgi:hypothetical protein
MSEIGIALIFSPCTVFPKPAERVKLILFELWSGSSEITSNQESFGQELSSQGVSCSSLGFYTNISCLSLQYKNSV